MAAVSGAAAGCGPGWPPRLACALLAAALGGCASPGRPVTQEVRVETPGCEQARCELGNDRGHWTLERTPGSVTITTSQALLRVSCVAEGAAQAQRSSGSSMASVTGAGAVAGGMVGGAAVGAAVGGAALSFIPPLGVVVVLSGVAAGAMTGQALESERRELRYPALVSVPMDCSAAAAAASKAGVPVGLSVRGLPPADARAAGLGERGAVLVTAVRAGSAAAASGLRAGDILTATDGRDLADAADFEERLRALPPGAPLELGVWRDGRLLVLRLQRPEEP